jgi:hypothetical protein
MGARWRSIATVVDFSERFLEWEKQECTKGGRNRAFPFHFATISDYVKFAEVFTT